MSDYDLAKLAERLANLEDKVQGLSVAQEMARRPPGFEIIFTMQDAADALLMDPVNLQRWLSHRKAEYPARYLHMGRLRRRYRVFTADEIRRMRMARGSGAWASLFESAGVRPP